MAGFVVAVTGGVASGKSAVTTLFESLGVAVVDADIAARAVAQPGQPALLEIAAHFGPEVILSDGSLDRVLMRAIVFADPEARRSLEAITHPRIRLALQTQCLDAPGSYAIAAIPLLAETGAIGAYPWLRRVLVVDCPVSLQRGRLMMRDGIDIPLASRMIDAQASRSQRLAIASDVIVNDGEVSCLAEPVRRLDALYRALATTESAPPE